IYRYVPLPLTHVCRIGLESLPYPNQMHHRQHYLSSQKKSKMFEHDRDGYTNAKRDFILDITKKAKEIYQNRYE
ncbi:MAG TPA: hypothetical protein VJZ48_01025, partial [Bacilli bacterium]|nr:hypothetical protein [Bacilli bacterium]